MAGITVYTRTYHARSDAQLVSRKGSQGGPMSEEELLTEFATHNSTEYGEPSALVTVSKGIIITLQAALNRYYFLGQSPDDIWIAFIEVPAEDARETPIRIHSTDELAAKCGRPNPPHSRHEVIVERAIPREYVSHQVSLETLIHRGLFPGKYFYEREPDSEDLFDDTRSFIASLLQNTEDEPVTTGLYLASFARKFGFRAPADWIAKQVFEECAGFNGGDRDPKTDDGIKPAPFGWSAAEFDLMAESIETALNEWAQEIADTYDDFAKWKATVMDRVQGLGTSFWEYWRTCDGNSINNTLSEEQRIMFKRDSRQVTAQMQYLLDSIEVENVKFGL